MASTSSGVVKVVMCGCCGVRERRQLAQGADDPVFEYVEVSNGGAAADKPKVSWPA